MDKTKNHDYSQKLPGNAGSRLAVKAFRSSSESLRFWVGQPCLVRQTVLIHNGTKTKIEFILTTWSPPNPSGSQASAQQQIESPATTPQLSIFGRGESSRAIVLE